MNKQNESDNLGWGEMKEDGVEIWDADPVFEDAEIKIWDWLKLLFYPKKFFLYRHLIKAKNRYKQKDLRKPFRILDVGCGTGATLVDLKKIFGREVEVVGLDVVRLQVDLAEKKLKQYGVNGRVEHYDGDTFPFPSSHFHAVISSDVLGHVEDVPRWLKEINRVMKQGASLAMFSESEVGKHAWVRKYLLNRGVNVDPHAEFHISLYSKDELKNLLLEAGFDIKKMYAAFWASFLVHPDEFYEKLQQQEDFTILRYLNKFLNFIKQKTHPVSTAICEFYGLIEMLTIGRWLETQGYVILGNKRREHYGIENE
ncbi:MAG: class I SAM-dependent methyltransferase [Candidatus Paceibacteria bacterium]